MATLNALVNRVCEQLEVTVEEGGLAAKVRACATAAGVEYTTLQATAKLLAVEVLGEAAPAAPSTPAAAPAPAPASAPPPAPVALVTPPEADRKRPRDESDDDDCVLVKVKSEDERKAACEHATKPLHTEEAPFTLPLEMRSR